MPIIVDTKTGVVRVERNRCSKCGIELVFVAGAVICPCCTGLDGNVQCLEYYSVE